MDQFWQAQRVMPRMYSKPAPTATVVSGPLFQSLPHAPLILVALVLLLALIAFRRVRMAISAVFALMVMIPCVVWKILFRGAHYHKSNSSHKCAMHAMYGVGDYGSHVQDLVWHTERRHFGDLGRTGLDEAAFKKVLVMHDKRSDAMDSELFGAVVNKFNQMIEQYQVPGCIVAVQRGSARPNERAIGYGTSDRSVEMRVDNHFKAGSVTKTATSVLMCVLIEQGHANLNDTIDRWREAVPVIQKVPNANQITILQMLSMQSGLADYESTKIFEDILTEDPEIHWNKLDLVRWAAVFGKPEFEPGKGWKYCNTGYIICGLIIEHVTGMMLDKAMKVYLFEPLGMTNTYLDTGCGVKKPHARGYGMMRDAVGYEDMTDWSSRWAYAAGAMVTTARDLLIWAKALGNGTILKQYRKPAISLLNESAVKNSPAFQRDVFFYGLGIVFDHNWVWHNGSIPGFETVCAYFKALDLSVVISINQTTLPKFQDKLTVVTKMFQQLTDIYTPGNIIGTRMPS